MRLCVILGLLYLLVACKSTADYDQNGQLIQKPAPITAPIKTTITLQSMDNSDGSDREDLELYVADDGCEYFYNLNSSGHIFTHKGSCRKCAERDSILLDKMLFEYIIKTSYEKKDTKLDSTLLIRKTIDSLQSLLPKKDSVP
jgi:hypothetical protein